MYSRRHDTEKNRAAFAEEKGLALLVQGLQSEYDSMRVMCATAIENFASSKELSGITQVYEVGAVPVLFGCLDMSLQCAHSCLKALAILSRVCTFYRRASLSYVSYCVCVAVVLQLRVECTAQHKFVASCWSSASSIS